MLCSQAAGSLRAAASCKRTDRVKPMCTTAAGIVGRRQNADCSKRWAAAHCCGQAIAVPFNANAHACLAQSEGQAEPAEGTRGVHCRVPLPSKAPGLATSTKAALACLSCNSLHQCMRTNSKATAPVVEARCRLQAVHLMEGHRSARLASQPSTAHSRQADDARRLGQMYPIAAERAGCATPAVGASSASVGAV